MIGLLIDDDHRERWCLVGAWNNTIIHGIFIYLGEYYVCFVLFSKPTCVCECIICLCFDDEGVRVRFSHAARYGIGGRISNNSRTRALPAVSCLLGHTHLGRLYHRAVPTHTKSSKAKRRSRPDWKEPICLYSYKYRGVAPESLSNFFFLLQLISSSGYQNFAVWKTPKIQGPNSFFFCDRLSISRIHFGFSRN